MRACRAARYDGCCTRRRARYRERNRVLIHAYNTPALEKGRPGAKAAVVVNSSGRAGRRWMREEQAATAVLTRGFDEVRVLLTTGPGSAEELTRNALQSGVDVVFAVGGDGTLNEVVNGFFTEDKLDILAKVRSRGSRLALVPMGTGCDFARNFAQPHYNTRNIVNILESIVADRAAAKPPDKIDLMRVTAMKLPAKEETAPTTTTTTTTTRICVNVVSVGLSAVVARIVGKFKIFGRKLAYVFATIVAFFMHRNTNVRCATEPASMSLRAESGTQQDDGVVDGTVRNMTCVAIGNGAYFGGGMKICPDASVSDSRLMMVMLKGFSVLDFLRKGAKLFSGDHVHLPKDEVSVNRQIAGVSITPDDTDEKEDGNADTGSKADLLSMPSRGHARPLFVETDGEVVGVAPVTVELLPAAVELYS